MSRVYLRCRCAREQKCRLALAAYKPFFTPFASSPKNHAKYNKLSLNHIFIFRYPSGGLCLGRLHFLFLDFLLFLLPCTHSRGRMATSFSRPQGRGILFYESYTVANLFVHANKVLAQLSIFLFISPFLPIYCRHILFPSVYFISCHLPFLTRGRRVIAAATLLCLTLFYLFI